MFGVVLTIGLISPSFSSNILGKIPDPIGSFLKNIDNRKKVLLVYGGIFFLLINLSEVLRDPFESGKYSYDQKNWSKAIEEFSKVPSEDENYVESQKLLSISKKNKFDEEVDQIINESKKKFQEDNWNEVMKVLADFPKDHKLFTEVENIISFTTGRKTQQMFIDKWKTIKENKDYVRGQIHLKENTSKINKWYGQIIRNDGNSVLVRYNGIEYTLSPRGPFEKSEINILKNLKKGDEVYFTGRLNGEKSITISGAVSEPEMLVHCSKISSIYEETIYYEITQENIDVVEWYENGKKKLQKKYKDVTQDYKLIEWYKNGNKKKESFYEDGEKSGEFKEWYENGKKKVIGNYNDGEKWTYWYENGNKISERIRKKNGNFYTPPTSRYYSKGIIENAKEDPDAKCWDDNGKECICADDWYGCGKDSPYSEYIGKFSGEWEAIVLGQYDYGKALFELNESGNGTVTLLDAWGRVKASHSGYINPYNDKFIITSGRGQNRSCSIVKYSNGFKIVLIWTGFNCDVTFVK